MFKKGNGKMCIYFFKKTIKKTELRSTGCRLLKGNGKEDGMEPSREGYGYGWPAGTLQARLHHIAKGLIFPG